MRDAILNASVPTGAVHKQGEKTLSCIAGEILTSGYTLAPADPAKKTTKVTYVVQVRESKNCYSVPVCIRARLYAAVCIHASEGGYLSRLTIAHTDRSEGLDSHRCGQLCRPPAGPLARQASKLHRKAVSSTLVYIFIARLLCFALHLVAHYTAITICPRTRTRGTCAAKDH